MFWLYGFILITSTLIFVIIGTWLACYLLNMAGIYDMPSARSNHSKPVARGGGVAIILPLLGFMLVAGAPAQMLWAALGVAIISFVDDISGVAITQRLVVHIAAVIIAVTALDGAIVQGIIPLWADKIIAGILLLAFLNIYNFMDGIDGLTGAQTIALGAGFIIITALTANLGTGLGIDGALLIAAAAGFLLFNWHPARIFMGDVGSIPLGLITGFLLLDMAAGGYWAAALILPAFYLTDAIATLGNRLINKEIIWQAHSKHAYQQAVRAGYSHDWVVIRISAFNIVAILLAAISTIGFWWSLSALFIAYAAAIYLRWHLQNLPPANYGVNQHISDKQTQPASSAIITN